MKKFVTVTATAAALVIGSAAPAAPAIGYTSTVGAWASYRADLDECLSASAFINPYEITLQGGRTATDHGEIAIRVRDNCQTYVDEEGEIHTGVIVFASGDSPSKGATVNAKLSAGSYQETLTGFDSNDNEVQFTVTVTWTGSGDIVRKTDISGGVRMTTADRPATATVSVSAGQYSFSGTTTQAGLFSNNYNSVGPTR